MADRSSNSNLILKKDLELVFEVNKKAIEIHSEVAGQNEELISQIESTNSEVKINSKKNNEILNKLEIHSKCLNELQKDIFKLQVLFVSGLLSLVIQIIQIFIKS